MSNKESAKKTIIVSLALCVVCSIVVSTAAVLLKPAQVANKSLDFKRNILQAAGLLDPAQDVVTQFSQVTTKIVDLDAGKFTDQFDIEKYDQRKASSDASLSTVLSGDEDIAKILQRVAAVPQRLRRRLGGGRRVLRLVCLDIVPCHLRPVDVGHKAVVHLGAQRHRGDRVRVGGVELAPEKKRIVAALHVLQLGAAGDFLAEKNRGRGGLPVRVVMVCLGPGPVVRAGRGFFAAPQFPVRPVVEQRHRLAKRRVKRGNIGLFSPL